MIENNVNLKPFNTFQIECIAQAYFSFKTEEELFLGVNKSINSDHIDVEDIFILGGGSNVLLPDRLNKLVIHPQNKDIVMSPLGQGIITVGAGVEWDDLVAYTVSHNLSGLECLTLIPGSVGASVVQNIGAYGAEVSEVVKQVRCFNIISKEFEVISALECEFDYRTSIFKRRPELLVVSVTFCLQVVPALYRFCPSLSDFISLMKLGLASIRFEQAQSAKQNFIISLLKTKVKMHFDKVRQLLTLPTLPIKLKRALVRFIRTKTMPDPKVVANVGCFFKSPVIEKTRFEALKSELMGEFEGIGIYPHSAEQVKVSAGDLIKKVGLNGYRFQNVKIEKDRPLIITSNGKATGVEIREFAEMVQSKVLKEFGIALEPEAVIVEPNLNSAILEHEVKAIFEEKYNQVQGSTLENSKELSA